MIFAPISTPGYRAWALAGLFAFAAFPALSAPFQAVIIANGTQGDLVQIQENAQPRSLRLYGVACPVTGQPGAEFATTHILETAMEAVVTVEIVAEDSNGTPVAWIKLPDGTSLNEDLVRKGLAWWDAPNAPEARNVQKAATEAIAAGRGLWATPAPLAPWDYRASNGLEAVTYKKAETETGSSATVRPAAPDTPDVPTLKAKGAMKDGAGGDYFPEDPAEHMALMLKHQPRIAYDTKGQPVGLTATDIASVPGAGRVGLRNGDIVRSVNGIALTSEAQVLGLVTQLQGAKSLELTVLRDGAPTQITIPLELE
jgi:endonuclease YncB( thermonuclease family)